jgi:hypothetical protein
MPKNIIIANIPDDMFAHAVNGFDNSSDAYIRLTPEEQTALVSERLFAYWTEVARYNAVETAKRKAAEQTEAMAAQMIEATKNAIVVTIEEAP